MTELFENTSKGAVLSSCGRFRYKLWRVWDNSKDKVLFLMHNPSTADASMDDPTIRRCIGFARNWGYGGIYVGNLTAFRATNPEDLKNLPLLTREHDDETNIDHIIEMFDLCSLRVMAYGNPVKYIRNLQVPKCFDKTLWHYLKLTKSGNPCHPLYLPENLKPIAYDSL